MGEDLVSMIRGNGWQGRCVGGWLFVPSWAGERSRGSKGVTETETLHNIILVCLSPPPLFHCGLTSSPGESFQDRTAALSLSRDLPIFISDMGGMATEYIHAMHYGSHMIYLCVHQKVLELPPSASSVVLFFSCLQGSCLSQFEHSTFVSIR